MVEKGQPYYQRKSVDLFDPRGCIYSQVNENEVGTGSCCASVQEKDIKTTDRFRKEPRRQQAKTPGRGAGVGDGFIIICRCCWCRPSDGPWALVVDLDSSNNKRWR